MKKIALAIAAAPLAFIATAANAGPTSQESFDVSASVLPECSMADINDVNFGNLAIETGSGVDALLLTSGGTRNDQNVWTSCNYAASITIDATPMTNQTQSNTGPDAGDFTDKLFYRVAVNADNGSDFVGLNLNTRIESTNTRAQTGAFHNDAEIRTTLRLDDNTGRPLSGDYLGTATVTLGAI